MMKKFEHLPLNQNVSQFQVWAKILTGGQAGNLYFLPHTGLWYRIHQFKEWFERTHSEIRLTHLELEDPDNPRRIRELFQTPHPHVVICKRLMTHPDGALIAQALQEAFLESRSALLLVHECAPSEIYSLGDWPSIVYQNEMLYTLPDLELIDAYIDNIAKDWKVDITNIERAAIISRCGNQLWLINEEIRQIAESHAQSKTYQSQERLERKKALLWQTFPRDFRQYLLGALTDKRKKDVVRSELERFGYMDSTKEQIMGTWIREIQDKTRTELIQIQGGRIICDHIDITAYFSQGEVNVLSRLQGTKELISREEIGRLLWQDQTDTKYSDWALDQAMSRLRRKVSELNIPLHITTKRGKGFLCSA